MAADAFFPACTCLIFPSVDLMPYGCVQFRIQRQDSEQEIVTINSPIMDCFISWVQNMAGTISKHTETIGIIGAFLLRKPLYAAHDLFVLLSHA